MRRIYALVSMIISVAMILSMSVPAFASDDLAAGEEPTPQQEATEPVETEETDGTVVEGTESEASEEVIAAVETLPEVQASAVGGTFGNNGALSWTYDNGVLTISGSGAMPDMDYGEHPWEKYYDDVKEVVIEDGVTSIGDLAFVEADIEKITIADSVERIGEFCFQFCSNLTSVELPSSLKIIEEYGFNQTGLTEVTIPEGVVEIGNSGFGDCPNLQSVHLPSTFKEHWG